MRAVNELRLGFIGHGVHARANLYPSIALAGGTIRAVATRTRESAESAAVAVGAKEAYDDVGQMLKAGVLDAVFVSIAPGRQAEIAEQCLRAGVSVFVEKPLGTTAEEARKVARAAKESGATAMVGFMKRFAPAYRTLATLVTDESRFGRPMVVDASFGFAPWHESLRDDTYLTLGAIHIVDLLRALFGEVVDVQGLRSSQGADIGMVFSFKLATGLIATLTLCGVPSWSREQERVTVTGTRGWASVENLAEIRYHTAGDGHATPARWQTLDEETHVLTAVNSPMSGGTRDLYLRGFAGEIAYFLERVASGLPAVPSPEDNVATMELCERLLAAVAH